MLSFPFSFFVNLRFTSQLQHQVEITTCCWSMWTKFISSSQKSQLHLMFKLARKFKFNLIKKQLNLNINLLQSQLFRTVLNTLGGSWAWYQVFDSPTAGTTSRRYPFGYLSATLAVYAERVRTGRIPMNALICYLLFYATSQNSKCINLPPIG